MKKPRQDRAWKDFDAWCRARRLRSLPAHPWTVAAYARWCEPRHRFKTIVERIDAIARHHVLKRQRSPHQHPTVTRTLRLIEARSRSRFQGAALFRAEDFAESRQAGTKPETPATRTGGKRMLRSRPRLVSRRPAG